MSCVIVVGIDGVEREVSAKEFRDSGAGSKLIKRWSTGWPEDPYHPETPAVRTNPRRRKGNAVGLSRREMVYQRDGGRCVYCERKLSRAEFTIDHRKPRSRGGSNAIENLSCCCQPCNTAKGNKTAEEFVQNPV